MSTRDPTSRTQDPNALEVATDATALVIPLNVKETDTSRAIRSSRAWASTGTWMKTRARTASIHAKPSMPDAAFTMKTARSTRQLLTRKVVLNGATNSPTSQVSGTGDMRPDRDQGELGVLGTT